MDQTQVGFMNQAQDIIAFDNNSFYVVLRDFRNRKERKALTSIVGSQFLFDYINLTAISEIKYIYKDTTATGNRQQKRSSTFSF